MRKILFVLLCFICGACSYAGPFVTNISQSKSGTLTVEKCQVKYNPWTAALSTENCLTYQL